MIDFLIKGIAIPQGRPRARVLRNGPKPLITMYDPPESKKWKEEVKKQAQVIKSLRGDVYYEGVALKVELYFYLPRPKSLPKKVLHHIKKPDCDNLAKGICDALNGVMYKDDSQIVNLKIRKIYCEDSPCVRVVISVVESPF